MKKGFLHMNFFSQKIEGPYSRSQEFVHDELRDCTFGNIGTFTSHPVG